MEGDRLWCSASYEQKAVEGKSSRVASGFVYRFVFSSGELEGNGDK